MDITTKSGRFTFQRERAQDLFDEVMPLLQAHFEEIAHFKHIPLEPDFAQYKAIEDSGALTVFTARDEAKKIVGYAVFFVRHNPHYKSSLQALQDIIYIEKERRGFGRHFITWCDEELKKDGIHVVYHHVKQAHNWGPMLEAQGYRLVDLIYAKEV